MTMPSEREADSRIAAARALAREALARSITSLGMMASGDGHYPQVWARDSMITLIGATAESADAKTLECMRVSIETLRKHQTKAGQIPGLVFSQPEKGPGFGSTDANAWFMLGAARYAEITADGKWIENMADAVVRAADWCETMDLCHDGLMVSPEVGDWADLLSWRGHVLFPNTLLAGALAAASRMLDKARPQEAGYLKEMRSRTTAALQDYFWVRAPAEVDDKSHSQVRKLIACQLRRRPYFLPWVGYYDYEDRFDTTGNLLAILCGVATDEQSSAILDFIDQVGLNRPYPVRVIYPPIQPGETAWREYYRLFNLNYPHQYHNGGIWPWVGGLYVAALVRAGRRERAGAELALLAAANLALKDGEPGAFNEWLHGETGKPMGARWQAWSAGMYLYACHAVESGACPGWEAARG